MRLLWTDAAFILACLYMRDRIGPPWRPTQYEHTAREEQANDQIPCRLSTSAPLHVKSHSESRQASTGGSNADLHFRKPRENRVCARAIP